jgi:hypothetical protein
MRLLRHTLLCTAALLTGSVAFAQYAPAAGVPGTSAIYKDSSVFIGWATQCEVVRGLQDVSNASLGYASAGDSSMALGIAGSNGIVSLGDGGYATMTFLNPVANGPGWDFAVFENSFSDNFLELAFVEVSSDGVTFFRFPAHSLTDTSVQTASFGATDPTKINNLAGKYRNYYGTPFDLAELSNIHGLNIESVTHIRVVDVIGNITPQYTTRDSANNPVNDPWPTAFPSGGFDLDAIGVIHDNPASVNEWQQPFISVFPNPANAGTDMTFSFQDQRVIGKKLIITNVTGEVVKAQQIENLTGTVPTADLDPGIYFVQVSTEEKQFSTRWLIVR